MDDRAYRQYQMEMQARELGSSVFTWLRKIGTDYKERGVFPLSLCDYYTEPLDKDVAAFTELIIPHNKKRDAYITEFRKILGNNPWKMVKERGFIFLNVSQNKNVLRCNWLSYSTIFNMLDWVWVNCVDSGIPMEHVFKGELGLVKPAHKYRLREVLNYADMDYRINMLMAKMCLPDGFGCGAWNIQKKNLKYPISNNTKKQIHLFCPFCKDIEKAISSMIYEDPIDYIYTEWGYERLRLKIPDKIERLERLYPQRYSRKTTYILKDPFKDLLPGIELDSGET